MSPVTWLPGHDMTHDVIQQSTGPQVKSALFGANIFPCLACPFWHLVTRAIIQFFSLVIMWCNFKQPWVLDLDDLSHELFGGKDKFVVDDPSWVVLSQTAVRVNSHCLLMLHCLVMSTLAEACRVVEEPRSDRLSHTDINRHYLSILFRDKPHSTEQWKRTNKANSSYSRPTKQENKIKVVSK